MVFNFNDMYQLTISYRLVALVYIILISSLLLLLSMSAITTLYNNQAFARCPKGTHISPSGDCEPVVPHAGLPRCPNGFHRSPSGICEKVESLGNNGGGTNSLNTTEHPPSSSASDNNNNNFSPPFAAESSNNNNNNNPMVQPFNTNQSISSTEGVGKCDQSLWNYVYNPQRLQIVDPCKTVSGITESKRVEADGDYHIRLKLDPQFANLVNAANVKSQFGDLVLEPICMNIITQLDVISSCQNFHQNIYIPPVGTHVQVTGSYVLDKEHGKWAEIHPVTSIIKIP